MAVTFYPDVQYTSAQQFDLAHIDKMYALYRMRDDRDAWLGAWLDAKSRCNVAWLAMTDAERTARGD